MKKASILLIVLMLISVGFLSGCTDQTALRSDNDRFEIDTAAQYDGLIVQVTSVGRDESYSLFDDNGEFVTKEAGEGWGYVSVYYTIWNDDRIYVNIGRLDFVVHDSVGNKYYSDSFDGVINYDTLNRVNILYKGESGYAAQHFLVPDDAVGLSVYYNLGTISSPNWVYWVLNVDSSQTQNEDEVEDDIPEPIVIDHNSYFSHTTTGSHSPFIHVYGLVKNCADVNIEFLQVTIKIYDKWGTIIDNKDIYVIPTIIEPDSIGCFDGMFYDGTNYYDDYDHYDVEIASFRQFGNTVYKNFELTEVEYIEEEVTLLNGKVEIQKSIIGNIKNTGNVDMSSVDIYAVYYDSNNKIVGMCFATIFGLDGGQKKSFKTLPIVTPDTFSDYELIIDFTEE